VSIGIDLPRRVALQLTVALVLVVALIREFLTGFSKRKQEKKEAARLRAAAREKEEAKLLRQVQCIYSIVEKNSS